MNHIKDIDWDDWDIEEVEDINFFVFKSGNINYVGILVKNQQSRRRRGNMLRIYPHCNKYYISSIETLYKTTNRNIDIHNGADKPIKLEELRKKFNIEKFTIIGKDVKKNDFLLNKDKYTIESNIFDTLNWCGL